MLSQFSKWKLRNVVHNERLHGIAFAPKQRARSSIDEVEQLIRRGVSLVIDLTAFRVNCGIVSV